MWYFFSYTNYDGTGCSNKVKICTLAAGLCFGSMLPCQMPLLVTLASIYIYIYIYPHTQILFVYDYHLHRKCRPLCHTNIHKKMCNNLIDPFTCIDPDLKTIYPGLMSLYINGYIFVSKKKKKRLYFHNYCTFFLII